ncbi:GAP family protein [Nonomuraea sp. MG754425]|uniref:GAP family protein n=1 Tax=Nonomuraea sp. MG754425 TaxID=2570319 RepID=UPI001F405F85|nr:GAP family protein [Nonomuraea sp. MG754425]MCF6476150.1 GAP family protein [Nonomuraea sp. MG754425]
MSIALIGAVLGLALLDTLSPAVIGVSLYVLLTRPRRTGALLGVYLGSVALAYFALGALLMLGLGALVPAVDETALAWAQAAFGVALIVGSYFIPERDPGRAPFHDRPLTVRTMALLGVGTWLFEFATAVPYFGAIGIMTAAGLPATRWAPLLGVYVTIMILPGVLLRAAWAVLPERARGRLNDWQRRLSAGSRAALPWMVWLAGVLLLLTAAPEQITVVLRP